MTDRKTVVQLFSGGLDSILAARIMKDEGFEVIGLHSIRVSTARSPTNAV